MNIGQIAAYNHDAELPEGLSYLGKTEDGLDVEINARAAKSDLLIYLNLTFVPMNGGFKSVGTGLAGYKTFLKSTTIPTPSARPRATWIRTISDPKASDLASKMESIGRFINSKLDVFHIESTINNACLASPSISWPNAKTT